MSLTPESLIIAVDGGGSNCRVCVFDRSGRALGHAAGGSANITTSFFESKANIEATIKAAYDNAGLGFERMSQDAAYLGLAGANIGDNAAKLQSTLDFARVKVASDRGIAVQGALGDGDGAVAQVGTGSFFTARIKGQTRNVGGWGLQLSDDCSGASLGRKLLRATIAAYDGLADSSDLTDQILAQFGGSPDEMVAFVQTATPKDYGSYTVQLVEAKNTGDAVATTILTTATARMVEILNNLDAKRAGRICLLGGMGPIYQNMLPDDYSDICAEPKGSPLDGAFLLAKEAFLDTSP